MQTMSLFALVRNLKELQYACDALSAFFAQRRHYHPSSRETLLGIWVEEHWVADLPYILEWRSSQALRVRETTGVSGIWMLCWAETAAGAAPMSRNILVKSLLKTFEHCRVGATSPNFIPVFDASAALGKMQTEMQPLAAAYQELLLSPLYQNPATGRLLAAAPEPRPGVWH
jgi:hypothetical protein